jgi:hypothetical protein
MDGPQGHGLVKTKRESGTISGLIVASEPRSRSNGWDPKKQECEFVVGRGF